MATVSYTIKVRADMPEEEVGTVAEWLKSGIEELHRNADIVQAARSFTVELIDDATGQVLDASTGGGWGEG